MNIRRFVAHDMREALASIRTDLGPDAVMLSSRKLPNGVEVIAAVDYDDSLIGDAKIEAAADEATARELDEYEQIARRAAPAEIPARPQSAPADSAA